MADEPVRRKPDKERKTTQIRIRISAVDKKRFTIMARREGLELSAWLRHLAATEIRKEARRTKEACQEEPLYGNKETA